MENRQLLLKAMLSRLQIIKNNALLFRNSYESDMGIIYNLASKVGILDDQELLDEKDFISTALTGLDAQLSSMLWLVRNLQKGG